MEERISRDKLNIEIAKLYAKRSKCSRLEVGAVAVIDGRIIATGYNSPIEYIATSKCTNCDHDKPCTKAIHAEANLIAFSAKNGIRLVGSKLYVTHSPCIKCAELIVQSGIEEVIYDQDFRTPEGLEFLIKNDVGVNKYEEPIQNS